MTRRGLLRWPARASERADLLAMGERIRRGKGSSAAAWLREARKPFRRP